MTAPANDNIADAIVIDITSGSYTSPPIDNSEATVEPKENSSTNIHSLWWKISYPVDLDIELDTAQTTPLTPGGTTDTSLDMWTDQGTYMGYLGGNDDDETAPQWGEPGWTGTSRLSFHMTGGTVYYISVAGSDETAVFNAVLHVTAANVPQPHTLDVIPGEPITDLSTPGYSNGNTAAAPTMPLGGLMGDGSLATNDGDASGLVIWETGMFDSQPAGNDQWRYTLDTTAVPADALAVRAELELTVRVVERTQGFWYDWDGVFHAGPPEGDQPGWQIVMPDGQGYSNMSTWIESSIDSAGNGTGEITSFGYTTIRDMFYGLTPAEWAEGTTLTFAAATNAGDNVARAEMRVTAAVLHITYWGGTQPSVASYGIPPLRQLQRGDAHGMSGAPRAVQGMSQQATLRNISFQ